MLPKALIVEDEPTTRGLLRKLVESQGCDVDEASDGERAIELLDRTDYGVILMDIALPKVSGVAVMDHLYTKNAAALERVMVVTGLNVEEIRSLFPTVCQTLSKPVIAKRLMESVRKCLRAPADTHFTTL
jgi:CheY-like chemotaxis protein